MIRFLKYAFLFPGAVAPVYISSCANDHALEMRPAVVDSTCIPAGYTVTYTNDIKTILETYCNNPGSIDCHEAGNSSGLDYTTYGGIAPEAQGGTSSNVYHRVFEVGDMPSISTLGPPELTSCDAAKLESWIKKGIPK
jgi:hypothetical protein